MGMSGLAALSPSALQLLATSLHMEQYYRCSGIIETGREDSVTGPGNQSVTTVNAPPLDNGCPDGNVSHLCLNTPSGPDLHQENHIVITVINSVQLVITCAGFLANGAT